MIAVRGAGYQCQPYSRGNGTGPLQDPSYVLIVKGLADVVPSRRSPSIMRFLLLLALPFTIHAGTVTYSASGVFGPTAPVSFFTAPNQTWAFTFAVDVNPSVTLTVDSDGFNPAYTGFVYRLNGVDLGLTPAVISFWESASDGMFGVDFGANNRLSLIGEQMFTGALTAPTMRYGVFVSTTGEFDYLMVDDVKYGSLAGTVVYATPEPGSLLLMAGGGLVLVGLRRRHLKAKPEN